MARVDMRVAGVRFPACVDRRGYPCCLVDEQDGVQRGREMSTARATHHKAPKPIIVTKAQQQRRDRKRKRWIPTTVAELQKARLRQLVGDALEKQKAQKDNEDYAHPLGSED